MQQQITRFDVNDAVLEADVEIPRGATAMVLFVHGSGSSRHSSRNRFVASSLRERGLGTVLTDLLTPKEEQVDAVTAHLRFDIEFLSRRVISVIDQVRDDSSLPLGLFGASTGAAAALVAAARRAEDVGAIVSRGGRPDLAGEALTEVAVPTLLIVGGADREVIDLNRRAMAKMRSDVRIEIVPGATHLFEEPGALDQVSALAGEWFEQSLKISGGTRGSM
jgi:putative phosphoribosyl transferase